MCEEAADFERRSAERIRDTLAVHPAWLDYGTNVLASRRTALIVDPADGRVPTLTPAAQQKSAARADARRRAEGPEDFSLGERCILFGAGPPILPGPCNNNMQIVQTRETVVVFNEMIHDARIVPMLDVRICRHTSVRCSRSTILACSPHAGRPRSPWRAAKK